MTRQLEETVLLITSDTYKDDVINLLCLEKGMTYRFRYREKWVPEGFYLMDEKGKEKFLSLVGKNCLVIFLDMTKKEFFPIMKVRINQIEKLGDVLHVEFLIDELIQYSRIDQEKNEHHYLIQKYIHKQYLSDSPWELKKYIFTCDFPISDMSTSNDVNSWSEILHNIWNLKPFKKSFFLKILKITDSRGNSVKPREIVSKTRETGYELNSSEIYKLEILQRMEDNFPKFVPFRLRLFSIGDHITPIKENAIIVGKYDKLILTLRTKWRKADTISIIGLKSDKQDNLDQLEVYIPIKIKKDTLKLAGSMLSIIAGFTVAGFSSHIAGLAQLSENISPLLGIVGAGLVALGVAWLRPMYE